MCHVEQIAKECIKANFETSSAVSVAECAYLQACATLQDVSFFLKKKSSLKHFIIQPSMQVLEYCQSWIHQKSIPQGRTFFLPHERGKYMRYMEWRAPGEQGVGIMVSMPQSLHLQIDTFSKGNWIALFSNCWEGFICGSFR